MVVGEVWYLLGRDKEPTIFMVSLAINNIDDFQFGSVVPTRV